MAQDVIEKVITANSIKNNSTVVGAMKTGSYAVFQHGVNESQSPSGVEVKYTNRFDDPTYYSS